MINMVSCKISFVNMQWRSRSGYSGDAFLRKLEGLGEPGMLTEEMSEPIYWTGNV